MEATSLCSLALLSSHPPSCNLFIRSAPFVSHNLPIIPNSATTSTRSKSCISASKGDSYGHGKSVDENMILLRMRIRQIETVEMKQEANSDWSEWEKNNFVDYDSDVCEAVGLLQRMLMNTRPCLALGMLALLMLSMSMSMSLFLFHVVDLIKGII